MVISIWDIFRYLYKHKLFIIITLCLCIAVSELYVYRSKTYSAEVVIEYSGDGISEGKAPDGTKLDVYEIVSPNVITKTIDELDLTANVDTIRSAVTITAIIPNDIATIKKSKEKEGEKYDYYPTQYSIKFEDTLGHKYGLFARDILNSIIKNYTTYYAEKHISQAAIANIDSDMKIGAHDYIEIAEIMDRNASNYIKYFEERTSQNAAFRSAKTGLGFADLATSFQHLKDLDLPALYAYILNNQVTRSKEVLLKKYAQSKDEYLLTKANREETKTLTSGLMDKFVQSNEKVANSTNTANDSTTGESQIASTEIVTDTSLGQEKTTYDNLIDRYVDNGVDSINSQINANYCDSIIEKFHEEKSYPVNTPEQKKHVEKQINTIAKQWNTLYKEAITTLDDYNAKTSSRYITWLSGVSVNSTISQKLYLAIGSVAGLGLGCLIAIAMEIVKEMKRHRILVSDSDEENETTEAR